MHRNVIGSWLILVGLLVCLIAAFTAILEMRFSPGDVYPHYSTKRSDPLGARAFYESLEKLSGFDVSRNVVSLQRIKGLDDETTLMFLGLSRSSLKGLRITDDSPVLEAVRNGTRLVIVMNPVFVQLNVDKSENEDNWFERREKLKEGPAKKGEGENGETEGEEESEEENETERGESFLKHVNIELMMPDKFERPEEGWKVKRVVSDPAEAGDASPLDSPEVFPNWRSQYRFKEPDDPWKVIATIDDLPIVVQRSYGKGEIVMTSDSYFASNEALWKGEDTSFLWWLIGGKQRVVFDETIHGSMESGGMMKLIRRYRLHGFFAGLFIFLALLAWSSSSSLVPGSEEMERGLATGGGAVTGEDASSGMVRLLRRSVRPGEMLERCVGIWRKSDGRSKGLLASLTPDQENEVERLLRIRKEKPKELSLKDGYEKLVDVLGRKQ